MRRLIVILTVLSLLVSSFAAVFPASAAASQNCWELTLTYDNSGPWPVSAGVMLVALGGHPLYTAMGVIQPGQTQQVSVHGFFSASATVEPFQYDVDFADGIVYKGESFFGIVSDSVCTAFSGIQDGRLNALDLGAPLAAYCSNGGIAVYDIDGGGQGALAFLASQEQTLNALTQATASGQNVLIAQGMGDSLYALSSNQLTLVGPDLNDPTKLYEHVIAADTCW